MVIVSRLAAVCFVVALPIFLVTANVRLLAGDIAFYKYGFREYDSSQRTGIALPELERAAGDIIDYFENDADTLRIVVNNEGQETSLFNPRETQHMKDVKSLMRAVFRLNEITLAVVLVYVAAVFLWAGERPLRSLAVQSLIGMGIGVAAIGFVGLFAATGFDSTWRQFHELVFSNDLWKLNPATDRLIQMFPEPFWARATLVVGVITAIEAVLIVAGSVLYLVFARGKHDRPVATPVARETTAASPSPEA